MKYIKEFANQNEYDAYIQESSEKPLVALINDVRQIAFNKFYKFKFYIGEVECEAEEGMTWYMWTESKYKNIDLVWTDNYNLRPTSDQAYYIEPSDHEVHVYKNTKIQEGGTFVYLKGSNVVLEV